MSNKLASLAIELSANITKFESDMGRAARIAKRDSERMKKQVSAAMKAIGASAIAAGAGLAALVKSTANTADAIQKMSDRLGVSTEFLSQYRHVAELSGTSLERVGDGIRKMSKSVNDANNGLSTATRAFDSLGISLDTLNSLSPEKQFELIADRMSKVESQSVKAGAAMDIFGRAGVDLLTVLNQGSEGIEKMRKEADSFGLTISQNAADAAAHFNDELTRLSNRVLGIKESIGRDLLPVFNQMIENFNSDGISNAAGKFTAINTTVITLYKSALYLNATFAAIGKTIGVVAAQTVQAFSIMGKYLDAFIDRVKLGALTIAELFTNDIKQKAEKIGASFMLPDFIANSTVTESADELRAKIDATEQEALQLRELFMQGIAEDSTVEEIIQKFVDARDKIEKVVEATKVGKNGIEDGLTKPSEDAADAMSDFGKSADSNLKKAQSLLKKLRSEHRPVETMFRDLANSMATLEGARLLPEFSEAEYQEGFELIQEQAETMAKEIVDTVKGIYDEIPKLFGESAKEIEQIYFTGMFDNFAAGLNPAIGALQSFRDEIGLIDDLTKSGQFTAGQEAFYKTGLTAEYALNSMASMAEEGSSAQKKLQAAAAITNTILGITAILEQGKGDPYTAFGRMAAMAALVASLGVQVTGAFGGSGGGGAAQQQATQGTGTVLGDANAKSESMANALDLIAEASEKIVGINSGMLRSLNSMNDAISGTVTQIARGGDIGNLGTEAGGFGGLSEIFGGTGITSFLDNLIFGSSRVIDQGIDIVSGRISEAIDGTLIGAYEVARRSGLFGSSTRTGTGALADGITQQIGLIFESMSEAILAGAESLGLDMGQVQAALESYRIQEQRISLMDLSPAEQQAELEAVFSSIFDGITEYAIPFITQFQEAGEGLGETLARVSTTVLVFEEAIESMGLEFIQKQVDPELFAQAAVAISDFAGGMDAFIDGYTNYVNNFLSEDEQLEILTGRLSGVFDNLDLELPDSREAFTDLIQGLDLTTEAGQEAFGTLIALSAQMDSYYDSIEEAQQEAMREQERAAEILAQNAEQLASMMTAVASDLEDMDLSPFAKRLKDIKDAFNEQIATAKELGASERELAMIQTYASRQIQQAIAMLENDIRGALTDLYGTELDQINEQIALLEQQGSMIQQVGQANQNRYQDELRAIQNIQGYLNSLLLDDTLSTLNPMEQLQEAQAQFEEMLALAQMGDIDALNALPGLANVLLGLGRDVWASGEQYTDLFDMVTGALSGLGVTSSPGGDNTGSVMIGQNAELIALQQRANELMEQQAASQNFDAAWAIAEKIGQLSSVTNDSFAELAERIGLELGDPLEQFLTDLGVDLENITVETSTALANVAATMGVEITELADAVGISLGDLADDQSLLNDALEATIMGLPQGIADDLDAMLTAIEKSTDPEEREALLTAMEDYISTLPADQANLLAPFFENIDPTTNASQQLSQMTQLNDTNRSIDAEIKSMRQEAAAAEQDANQDRGAIRYELGELNSKMQQFLDTVNVA